MTKLKMAKGCAFQNATSDFPNRFISMGCNYTSTQKRLFGRHAEPENQSTGLHLRAQQGGLWQDCHSRRWTAKECLRQLVLVFRREQRRYRRFHFPAEF